MGTDQVTRIKVSKVDAARRQLNTAVRMWFYSGDPVAIHTLAFAAYEVLHAVSKARKRTMPLLFDSPAIKPEYRKLWADSLKKDAIFFKHGDRDPEGIIEFPPEISELFMLMAIMALELCGETLTGEMMAFRSWIMVHHPKLIAAEFLQQIQKAVPAQGFESLKMLSKDEFLKSSMEASSAIAARRGF